MATYFVFGYDEDSEEWGQQIATTSINQAINAFVNLSDSSIWENDDCLLIIAIQNGIRVESHGYAVISLDHCTKEQWERYVV